MADPSVWRQGIPEIQEGEPVSPSVANAPHTALSSKVNALREMIEAVERGEMLVLQDRPTDTDVSAGDVVYFNEDTLTYSKASAKWKTLTTAESKIEPDPSAMFAGVVLTQSSANSGNILLFGEGAIEDAAMLVLFGTLTPDEGIYYLSALTPGQVQATSPLMSMRTLRYIGSNTIQMLSPDPQPITHSHKAYTLDATKWTAAAAFAPAIVPAGATYGYSFVGDAQDLEEALLPTVSEAAYVYAEGTDVGLHVPMDDIESDSNGIWWFDAVVPTDDIYMMVTVAETHGVSVLYSITSYDTSLTVSTTGGRVLVTYNEYTEEDSLSDHIVVKQLADHKQGRGPVVKSLQSGLGITLTSPQGVDTGGNYVGDVVVQLTGFDGWMIPAQILNMNNAVTSVDSPFVFTRFPEDRDSEVTCAVQLPDLSDTAYLGTFYALFLSPASAQAAPTIKDVRVVPTPLAAGVTPVTPTDGGGVIVYEFPDFPAVVVAGDVYLLAATETIALTSYSRGQVLYTIQADEPSTGLKMIGTGMSLSV